MTRRLVLFLLVVVAAGVGTAGMANAAEYVGSDKCMGCHGQEYNEWKASGHPYKLRTAEEIKSVPVPLPEGYTWDDISYVIGGYKWKARYMDKKGYIITSTADGSRMHRLPHAKGSKISGEV